MPGVDQHRTRTGVAAGLTSYALWGLFPFYFHALRPTGALELLAQRVVWTFVLCLVLVVALRRGARALAVVRSARQRGLLALAAAAIAVNWGVYGLAVVTGHVLEASLGYFVNPLITVLLGVLVLRERLRRSQWVAVGTGLVAVVVITADLGRLPWMALTVAVSFASYGLLKNRLARAGGGVDPLSGLTLETTALLLPAAAALIRHSETPAATCPTTSALVAPMPVRATSAAVMPPLLTTTSTSGSSSRTALVSAAITFSPWARVPCPAERTRSLATATSGAPASRRAARAATSRPAAAGSCSAESVATTSAGPCSRASSSSWARAPSVCEPQTTSTRGGLARTGRGSRPALATPASSAASGAAQRTSGRRPRAPAASTAAASARTSSSSTASGTSTDPAGAPRKRSSRARGSRTTSSGTGTGVRVDFSVT
ncbi:EamA family transporter RarD [Kineococcus sp. T13]|nr:EamA family transporter RarD [Kineococcus vitellinus]